MACLFCIVAPISCFTSGEYLEIAVVDIWAIAITILFCYDV